jgi:hypothetical protein
MEVRSGSSPAVVITQYSVSLRAAPAAERHNVPQVAVRLRVEFVEDDDSRVQAVLRVRLGGKHLQERL